MQMNNETKKKDKVVIYLSSGGYKLSSWYGKILTDAFDSLASAKQACIDAGYDYVIA